VPPVVRANWQTPTVHTSHRPMAVSRASSRGGFVPTSFLFRRLAALWSLRRRTLRTTPIASSDSPCSRRALARWQLSSSLRGDDAAQRAWSGPRAILAADRRSALHQASVFGRRGESPAHHCPEK